MLYMFKKLIFNNSIKVTSNWFEPIYTTYVYEF